jgi:hypothetical protein
MPFLGQTPPSQFSSIAKQTITGNSGTTYSLDYSVTNSNELEVFVNNVRQEPGVAYTASGTSIVFSEAVASTDSIYVVYQGRSIGTVAPASASVTSSALANNLEFPGQYIKLPVGTTAERPSSAEVGYIRHNTTTGEPEWYDATTSIWVAFADRNYVVEYLVIAGGGGGGDRNGGGGGAGGFVEGSNLLLTKTAPYTITVGAGGTKNGNNGSASSISYLITAIGGGAGSWNTTATAASSGGSGGGGGGGEGSGAATNGASGTAGQGFAGGNGSNTNAQANRAGAGGGGAGEVGGNASTS